VAQRGKIAISSVQVLEVHRANINNMHVNLFWLEVEERLTSALIVFVRGIDMLKEPSFLFK
jgi:hypothetical protein